MLRLVDPQELSKYDYVAYSVELPSILVVKNQVFGTNATEARARPIIYFLANQEREPTAGKYLGARP